MTSYILKDIFGDTKRVRILEELVERWGEYLSVSEIARMTDVSPNTVYAHIYELEELGIVKSKEGRAIKYGLNTEDNRAQAIVVIEDEEYLRKIDISITENEEQVMLEKSYLKQFESGLTDFETTQDGRYQNLEAESK